MRECEMCFRETEQTKVLYGENLCAECYAEEAAFSEDAEEYGMREELDAQPVQQDTEDHLFDGARQPRV